MEAKLVAERRDDGGKGRGAQAPRGRPRARRVLRARPGDHRALDRRRDMFHLLHLWRFERLARPRGRRQAASGHAARDPARPHPQQADPRRLPGGLADREDQRRRLRRRGRRLDRREGGRRGRAPPARSPRRMSAAGRARAHRGRHHEPQHRRHDPRPRRRRARGRHDPHEPGRRGPVGHHPAALRVEAELGLPGEEAPEVEVPAEEGEAVPGEEEGAAAPAAEEGGES